MKSRIKRIFGNFGKRAPDAILINYGAVRDFSFFHATGFIGGSFEGSSAVLLPDGSCTAIVPQLEQNTAEKENSRNRLNLDIKVYANGQGHIKSLKAALKGAKTVGANFSSLSVGTFNRLKDELAPKFMDASMEIREARLVKDADEIEKIRKAVGIAGKAFDRITDGGVIAAGTTESDVAAELIYQMRRSGGPQSFPPIIAFQENAAEPHYATGDRRLKRNGLVLIDWGAKFERYCSDLTRTFVLGRMDAKQEELLETVHGAQEVAFDLMQEGVDAAAVHSAVKDFIDKAGYKGKFVHATGHSLGLEVHDGKGLGTEKFRLKENMVMTVEPGIYLKGWGGARIEDDVVIRKNGIEKLSAKGRFFEL